MDEISFIKNFPSNKEVPNALLKLFRYQESVKDNYSGSFYLDDTLWDAPFADELRPYFVLFGSDVSGSMYAFWLYHDFPLESAPVVYLEFEGERNAILTNSLNEFLSILGLGVDELGYYIDDPEWRNHIIPDSTNLRFREWLKTELNIEVLSDPKQMIENARENHPNLNTWINQKASTSKTTRKS